nr:DUF6789 family protein [Acuticoccus kandeliae]
MGFLPQVDLLKEVTSFNVRVGLPTSNRAVWGTHVVLGVLVFPVIFALLCFILPGRTLSQGLTYGVILWLAMMTAFMPLAGHEMFARDLGLVFLGATLGFCLVYGALLAITYVALTPVDDD